MSSLNLYCKLKSGFQRLYSMLMTTQLKIWLNTSNETSEFFSIFSILSICRKSFLYQSANVSSKHWEVLTRQASACIDVTLKCSQISSLSKNSFQFVFNCSIVRFCGVR